MRNAQQDNVVQPNSESSMLQLLRIIALSGLNFAFPFVSIDDKSKTNYHETPKLGIQQKAQNFVEAEISFLI